MEIPVINRIIEFETNMKALHNPSFASQALSVSNTFMKWSAFILALIASFTTIINRVKILIIRLQRHPSLLASQQQNILHDDGDDDYDSDTASSCSVSEEEYEEEEEEDDDDDESEEDETGTAWSFRVEDDFGVRGSGHVYIDEQRRNCNLGLRQRGRKSIGEMFSWSEFPGGKSVVKVWDNLGLGLGFDVVDGNENENGVVRGSDSGNLFAIYNANIEREIGNIGSVFGAKSGISARVANSLSSSPSVTMVAAADRDGSVFLKGWDSRIGSRIPAIIAEWRPKLENVVGALAGGLDKIYVRNDANSGLTVGDMRKVNWPLGYLADTWWDSDAVITDEYFGDSTSSK